MDLSYNDSALKQLTVNGKRRGRSKDLWCLHQLMFSAATFSASHSEKLCHYKLVLYMSSYIVLLSHQLSSVTLMN